MHQGVAVSLCQSFVFAAGLDNRVRGWSLITGDPILPPSPEEPSDPAKPIPVFSNFLEHHFAEPVTALKMTGFGKFGLTLWAASGRDVFRYGIGQKLDHLHAASKQWVVDDRS